MQQAAGTTLAVFVEFFHEYDHDSLTQRFRRRSTGGSWSEPELFFAGGAARGETKGKAFESGVGSTKIRFRLNSSSSGESDAWGLWRVEIDEVAVLLDPAGVAGTPQSSGADAGAESPYWISAVSEPSNHYFFVPKKGAEYIASENALGWQEANAFCTANNGFIPWAENEGQSA